MRISSACLGVALALLAAPASAEPSTLLLKIPGASGDAGTTLISAFRQNFLPGSCVSLTVTRPLDRSSGLFAAAASAKRTFPEIALLVRDAGSETLRVVYRNVSVTQAEIATGPEGALERIEFAPASMASVEIHRASASGGEEITRIEMSCAGETGPVAQQGARPMRIVLRPGW